MSAFGGLILTNKGRNLQAKAQAGTQLVFTRIAVGDGNLGGSSILDLNALKNQVKSLALTKLQVLTGGKAVVGAVLSNQGLAAGFYWREIGLFAQDPDLGEILYCYGNSGANAEYIPADGGPDVVEKSIDVVSIVGNAANVTATIEQSLVFATQQDLDDLQAMVDGKETPAGAQDKVDTHDNTTNVHGATSAATANRLMMRDASGRAKVAAPVAADDIARKQEVDGKVSKIGDTMTGKLNITGEAVFPSLASKNASDAPSTYPTGISMFYTSSTQIGWPATNCIVTTFIAQLGSGNRLFQIINEKGYPNVWIRNANNDGSAWNQFYKLWTEGNDGIGSGLDADLLQGITLDTMKLRQRMGVIL